MNLYFIGINLFVKIEAWVWSGYLERIYICFSQRPGDTTSTGPILAKVLAREFLDHLQKMNSGENLYERIFKLVFFSPPFPLVLWLWECLIALFSRLYPCICIYIHSEFSLLVNKHTLKCKKKNYVCIWWGPWNNGLASPWHRRVDGHISLWSFCFHLCRPSLPILFLGLTECVLEESPAFLEPSTPIPQDWHNQRGFRPPGSSAPH